MEKIRKRLIWCDKQEIKRSSKNKSAVILLLLNTCYILPASRSCVIGKKINCNGIHFAASLHPLHLPLPMPSQPTCRASSLLHNFTKLWCHAVGISTKTSCLAHKIKGKDTRVSPLITYNVDTRYVFFHLFLSMHFSVPLCLFPRLCSSFGE